MSNKSSFGLGTCLALALALAVSRSAGAVTIFDSNGFEAPAYSIGSLDGQHGFVNISAEGSAPEVVIGPDAQIAGQAVRLQVPDLQGATSGWELPVADILAAGYTQVTVSFDIDKAGNTQNVMLVESDPPGLKDEAVLRHIRRSRFRPLIDDGAVKS